VPIRLQRSYTGSVPLRPRAIRSVPVRIVRDGPVADYDSPGRWRAHLGNGVNGYSHARLVGHLQRQNTLANRAAFA
jgi:hypothetical protein